MSSERIPDFMNFLDDDPKRAMKELYEFIWRATSHSSAPRIFLSLQPVDQDEVRSLIFHHCIDDKFKRLRKFSDQGSPFGGWFYKLILNKTRDYMRKHASRSELSLDGASGESDTRPIDNLKSDDSASPELRENVGIVKKCLEQLFEDCQIYLRYKAEEYTNLEIAFSEGFFGGKARAETIRIAARIAYCRKLLEQCVEQHGLKKEDRYA